MRTRSLGATLLALGLPLLPLPAAAQELPSLVTRLAAMTAVTGFEQRMADTLRTLLPGSVIDRAGSVVRTYGSGSGGTLVTCPMDEVGYVVGEIRADGWLTLRRVGNGAAPGADRWLEGERITVWTSHGALAGVVAVRSVHLARGRRAGTETFTADDALVDVGAVDSAAALGAGVAVLDPVAREKRPITYGDGRLAAPSAGRRAACAALLISVRASRPVGRVVVAFTVERQLGRRGLLTLVNTLGPFDRTLLVDGHFGTLGSLAEGPDSLLARRVPGLGAVTRVELPAMYPGTPVETIAVADVRALADRLTSLIGGAR